jgi:hypothetical protein
MVPRPREYKVLAYEGLVIEDDVLAVIKHCGRQARYHVHR